MGHVWVVVVRELTWRTVHGGARVELLLRLWLVMCRRMLLLLHSGCSCGRSSHVIRMVVVVMMGGHISQGQVQMGRGHAGLGLHLAVHVLVDVIRVGGLLSARRSIVEVGFVVQRRWSIAMLRLLLLVILARELTWEALLGISQYAFRSSWGGFL